MQRRQVGGEGRVALSGGLAPILIKQVNTPMVQGIRECHSEQNTLVTLSAHYRGIEAGTKKAIVPQIQSFKGEMSNHSLLGCFGCWGA